MAAATERGSGIHDSFRHSSEKPKSSRTNPEPSGAVVGSQSVQTTEQGGIRGYDAGKNVSGRKRHVLVEALCAATQAAMFMAA
jgi:putative transposase